MVDFRKIRVIASTLFLSAAISLAIACGGGGGDSSPSGGPIGGVGSSLNEEVAAGAAVNLSGNEGILEGFSLSGATFGGNQAVEVTVQAVGSTNLSALNMSIEGTDFNFESAGPTVEVKAVKKGTDEDAVIDGLLSMRLPVDIDALQALADEYSRTLDDAFIREYVMIKVEEEDGSIRTVVPALTGHDLSGDDATVLLEVGDFSRFHAMLLRLARGLDLVGSNASVQDAVDAFNGATIDASTMRTKLNAAFADHPHNPRAKLWGAVERLVRVAASDATSSVAGVPFVSAQEILTSLGATDGMGNPYEIRLESEDERDLELPMTVNDDFDLPTAGNTLDRVVGYGRDQIVSALEEADEMLSAIPSDFEEVYQDDDNETFHIDQADVLLVRAGIQGMIFAYRFLEAYNVDNVNFAQVLNDTANEGWSINTDFLDAHPNLFKLGSNHDAKLNACEQALKEANRLYQEGWDILETVATSPSPDMRTNNLFALDPNDPNLSEDIEDEANMRAIFDKAIGSISTGAFDEDFASLRDPGSEVPFLTRFNLRPIFNSGVDLRMLLPDLVETDDDILKRVDNNYDSTLGGLFPQLTDNQFRAFFDQPLVSLPVGTATVDGVGSEWPSSSLIIETVDASSHSYFSGSSDTGPAVIREVRGMRSSAGASLRIDFDADGQNGYFEIEIENEETGEHAVIQDGGYIFLPFNAGGGTAVASGATRSGKLLEVYFDFAELSGFGMTIGANDHFTIKVLYYEAHDGQGGDYFVADEKPSFSFQRP